MRGGGGNSSHSVKESDSKILQEKAEMQNLDSRRQDFGDKNGALQADSWEHTQAYVTEAEAKQSPFLAQKPTPQADSTPTIASTAGQSPTPSLRGSEATEAIHNTESTKVDSSSLDSVDCHALQGKARNDREADSKAESTSKSDSKILQEKAQGDKAEAVEMRNRGFQGGGEGSYLEGNDRADNAESAIYRSNATPEPEIILDFFAGSGTTAHAVMELNAQDGGNRKCILVQLDEEIDESKSKTAYDFCKNELGSTKPVISDITIERVKRAGEKIKETYKDTPLELGFSVFSMVEKPSLISDERGSLELREQSELSPRDKARNLSLFDSKMLHLELQEIIKDSLYQCEQSLYVVALSDAVLAHLRESKNEKVYISGYDIASLEAYKNLESFLSTRLQVVY